MLLKKPGRARRILERLTDFILMLKSVYASAGIDFIVIEEGGAASVSPKMFDRLLLPNLQTIFTEKPCPMVISMTGGSDSSLDFLMACDPDGVGIDRRCDTAGARKKIPPSLPLFTGCGAHDMLANGSPEIIAATVYRRLTRGATTVGPPADIYPPARMENIKAFIRAVREYPAK